VAVRSGDVAPFETGAFIERKSISEQGGPAPAFADPEGAVGVSGLLVAAGFTIAVVVALGAAVALGVAGADSDEALHDVNGLYEHPATQRTRAA
jgi:hypothetical protein